LTLLPLRALNRATLGRQLLLQRSPMSAIEHLLGMLGEGESTSMRVTPYVDLDVVDDVVVEGNRLLEHAFGVTEPRVEITP
jgi:hypothetical protein